MHTQQTIFNLVGGSPSFSNFVRCTVGEQSNKSRGSKIARLAHPYVKKVYTIQRSRALWLSFIGQSLKA